MNPQSTYNPQGSSPYLQGSSPSLQQSSSPQLAMGMPSNGRIVSVGYAQQPAAQAAAGVSSANSGGGGYSSGSYVNPALINAINQNYAIQQQGYQQQLDALDPAYNDNTGLVNRQYGDSSKTLGNQYNSGINSNKLANEQLATSRANTLRDLTRQMTGMIQGYGNQLGNYGAGDSSAVGLINYALTQQGNRSINDANTQANFQQTGLNNQKDNLQNTYDDQMRALDTWKQQSLAQLAQAYSNARQQFTNAINGSKAQQAQTIAQYGGRPDSALLASLANLDKNYGDARAQLDAAYNKAAPGVDLSKYNNFSVTPINPQNLAGADLTPVTSASVNAPVNIKRINDTTQV